MIRHAFISRRQHAFGAFDEIRNCDSNSILVMRRMRALIQELSGHIPRGRRLALQRYLEDVDNGIRRAFENLDDRKDALEEDRHGLVVSPGQRQR